MSEPTKNGETRNEGEGNRTADRKYREDVRRHIESGAPEPAAEEAQEALEGPEAGELRRAEDEDEAKKGRKNYDVSQLLPSHAMTSSRSLTTPAA